MHLTTRLAPALALGLTTLVACDCSNCDDADTVQSVPVATDAEAVTTRQPSPAGTPARALEDMAAALKDGRISALLPLATTDEEFGAMVEAWDEKRVEPFSKDEDAEFKEMMRMLTAEGAEELLFGMVEPQLAEAQQQLAMLAAMAPMMAAGALQDADAPAEAGAMIASAGAKLATIDIANPHKAKQAIAIVCDAARSLELDSMQDVARLEFDEVLDKGDTVIGALMGVLAVYELDLSETLESVRVTTIEVTDDTAELSIRMELFGVETDPLPIKMERVDGRWVMERPEPEVAPRELERPAPATEGK